MNPKSRIHIMIIFLIFASLACGVSDLTGSDSASDGPGALDTAVARSLAETASMQTAVAQGVANAANPTQGGGAVGAPTIQVQLSSQTPSITVSPTTDKAMVSVSQSTNCRSGPGTTYEWLGALNPGQEVEIFGKDPSGSSFYIKNPTNQSGFCWIWITFATVTGDTAAVPVYTPMPTPTPAKTSTPTTPPIDFNVSYSEIFLCGVVYYMEFNITNTGSLIWQSYSSVVTDNTTSVTNTHQKDRFEDYSSVCVLIQDQDDLAPGESGKMLTQIVDNLAGHSMTATFKLCSTDGLGGNCLSKTINFTP